ncbi:hypothetical protein [Urbifossiella limnaea]|uniref:Uncharacterized protein n=1 Tax=Urbifossiella limnaea TaxID=2528023 RepID=A0A517XZ93_9BACT|nr:hypothetical protein [Urbifossiella limnaea]QDU22803.1 hypothetical protein ETAA1_47910 [Urbifossiella limnaea]
MKHAAAFLVALVAVCAARADLAVPPPAGKKFVTVDHVVTTDKTYPEHEFYLVTGFMGDAKLVPFGPDTPVKIDGARRKGPYGQVTFAAVPKGAGEKFAGMKEFGAALRKGTVPGQATAKHAFPSSTTIDAKDTRTVITETLAVEKIDAKAGIVLKALKKNESGNAPPPRGESPSDDETAVGDSPRGGSVVAGLAAALAMAFAGLRLARRKHV